MWQEFFYFLTTIVLVVIPPQSVLVELLYLFFQRHSADQVIHTLLNGSFGIFVDGLLLSAAIAPARQPLKRRQLINVSFFMIYIIMLFSLNKTRFSESAPTQRSFFKEYKQVHARAYLKIGLSVSVMEACSLFFSSNTTISLLPAIRAPAGISRVFSAFSSQ